jgi:hypothetical protein
MDVEYLALNVDPYQIVPILILLLALPAGYFFYRRMLKARRGGQPTPPQVSGSMNYGEQPPFNGPQPSPEAPYDLGQSVRSQTRIMWWIAGAWVAFMVVLIIVMAIVYT